MSLAKQVSKQVCHHPDRTEWKPIRARSKPSNATARKCPHTAERSHQQGKLHDTEKKRAPTDPPFNRMRLVRVSRSYRYGGQVNERSCSLCHKQWRRPILRPTAGVVLWKTTKRPKNCKKLPKKKNTPLQKYSCSEKNTSTPKRKQKKNRKASNPCSPPVSPLFSALPTQHSQANHTTRARAQDCQPVPAAS